MAKFFKIFSIFLTFFMASNLSYAANKNTPHIEGDILLMLHSDFVSTTKAQNIDKANSFLYAEADFSLNFDKNWSVKTNWRLFPESQISSHPTYDFTRYHTFLNASRGYNFDDSSAIIEELKVDFENEDLNFYFGKFDPGFGKAHNKSRRIGVFTWQFNEDYNLREKLGGGVAALLEDSRITLNSFFNDTTGLSKSAIQERGRASRDPGIAGSNGTLSSYSVSVEGKNIFGLENLFYNVGYRNLGVDKTTQRKREFGYVAGAEYLFYLTPSARLIPLFEAVKIDNFGGAEGRDAFYYTLSLIASYSSWTISATYNKRDIKSAQEMLEKIEDSMFQTTVGYKINKNLTIDFTRASLDENNNSATIFGANLSYLHRF